ncbi:AfsR/SARP family transcriptional regulator [Streptomyces hesseae]|uniref:AfsR/SARP family transcriptional regulator n=1 Tax=Streptomyces hesseae TaxID=3075519 RepID=A0ABU2SHD3_9ACTN|nr:AfsR/SARP family transcriptional regulator [Streptomyces sp. DSM 40473]MDT0448382.1 AfsR/SARP family transcriptional regulator [Streptomyces sp. DSM 40473]
MGRDMSFRVLGPLEVAVGGRKVPIPGGRPRSLLAALLVNAGDTLTPEDLVHSVWGDSLPRQPRPALHTAMTRLRQGLDGGGADLSRLLHTSAGGYRLDVPPDSLDLHRFRRLTRRARAAGRVGDLESERTLLADALPLWRGRPLADVRSEELYRDVVQGLTEEWIRARERYHDVCLALGRHDEIVADLRTLTAKYPFHERLWHQLMLALYRCGRRGEALEVYAQVRGFFRDELGVDPGAELHRLHLAMLRTDGSLLACGA